MCFGDSGAEAANRAAVQQRQEEKQRQQRIRSGMGQIDQIFSPFNDAFFRRRGETFLSFARPQLEDQYGKAREALIYALSRNGLLNSSVAATKFGDLKKSYDVNAQALEGRANDEANKARQTVEQNRSDLVAQLQATADPTAAANAAIARQTFLSSTPGYEPLGALFANVTAGLADATNTEKNGFSGINLFNTGTSSKSGSSRVVT